MSDIREARFYVVDEDDVTANVDPLAFDVAFDKANALIENGSRIKVLCTGEASQTEIARFVQSDR